MRGLQPQQTLDRHLQRIILVIRLRLVPPALLLWIEAQPAPPQVEVALDVVLARIVEEHGAVAELVLVGRDAEDVRRQHQRGLPLVAVELVDGLPPILAAGDVALVLGDHERNAVDKQHGVLAALPHALHAVLVGRSEVVQVLPSGLKRDELHRLRIFVRD